MTVNLNTQQDNHGREGVTFFDLLGLHEASFPRRRFLKTGIAAISIPFVFDINASAGPLEPLNLSTENGSLLLSHDTKEFNFQWAWQLLDFFSDMYGLDAQKPIETTGDKIVVHIDNDPLGILENKITVTSLPAKCFSKDGELHRVLTAMYIAVHTNGDGLTADVASELRSEFPAALYQKNVDYRNFLRSLQKNIMHYWAARAQIPYTGNMPDSVNATKRAIQRQMKDFTELFQPEKNVGHTRDAISRVYETLRLIVNEPYRMLHLPGDFRLTKNTLKSLDLYLTSKLNYCLGPELENRLYSFAYGMRKFEGSLHFAEGISFGKDGRKVKEGADEQAANQSRLAAGLKAFEYLYAEGRLSETNLFIPDARNAVPEYHFKFSPTDETIAVPMHVAYGVKLEDLSSRIPQTAELPKSGETPFNLDEALRPEFTIEGGAFKAFMLAVSCTQSAQVAGKLETTEQRKRKENATNIGINFYKEPPVNGRVFRECFEFRRYMK